jgi:hypothetical protein
VPGERVRYLNPHREPIGYSFSLDDLRLAIPGRGWAKTARRRALVAMFAEGRAARAGGR